MAGEKIERLRRHSRWLSRLTLALLLATALIILLPTVIALAAAAQGRPIGRNTLTVLVLWLPAFFYLYALWAIARSFGAFARGGVFGPAMAKGCRRAGVALALGGTASAVGVPNLLRILARQGSIDSSPYGNGSVLIFDTAYLAVGVVGISFFLLGGLIERAAEMQQEAQELRAELGGFV